MDGQLILDRYRPLEELGQGAFGSVVLAWDTRMQRRVAIKRLSLPRRARERELGPTGLAEARTAAMLNHPAIVTVFDFDTDADEAFLVMEYVDGASLVEVLDAVEGPLSPDEAAAVLGDVFSAVEFAHENGVLHLDLKPENVLITSDGRAKVADFGMAELSSLSGHGPAWGGTPGYMPLEQLRGEGVTEATDQWALGALAFEVLTGDNPYLTTASGTADASARSLVAFEPPLPSERNPELDAEIDDILLTATARLPSTRLHDVAELADELLPLLGDPADGRASLSEIVTSLVSDEEVPAERHAVQQLGLWDRMQGRGGYALVRLFAAMQAGWLAYSGLLPLELEPQALMAAAAVVAAVGALAPTLGVGLGLVLLLTGLWTRGFILAALIVGVVGGSWWWGLSRKSPASAVLPLSAPVLAMARVPFVQPLVAGFSLPPLAAGLTALVGGGLAMLASAASGNGAPYLAVLPAYALDVWRADLAATSAWTLATSAGAAVALLGWAAAAVVMSAFCRRATRLFATLGAIAGSAVLGGAYALAEVVAGLTGAPGGYMSVSFGASLAVSLILVVLLTALGAPVRGEEEDPFELAGNR